MGTALILYGSRARGEARSASDVDLIFAKDGMSLESPRIVHGVSVHLYSKGWLEAEAQLGSLFSYHVAYEGIALYDEDDFLKRLQGKFRRRDSYRAEIQTAALILRMLLENDWRDNRDARRRYFWAIRTILISDLADHGAILFASSALEKHAGIPGLAAHIDARDDATFNSCARFGALVLRVAGAMPPLTGELLRDHLIALGGIARDTVRVVEEREALELGGLVTYL